MTVGKWLGAKTAVTALVLAAVLSGPAMAGTLSGDPNAYYDGTRTWTGSALMVNDTSGLTVNVDWCVYAPGHFPGTAYTYSSADLDTPGARPQRIRLRVSADFDGRRRRIELRRADAGGQQGPCHRPRFLAWPFGRRRKTRLLLGGGRHGAWETWPTGITTTA